MDFVGAFHLDAAIGRVGRQAGGPYGQPLFTVRRGQTVVLGLSNPTSGTAYMHLHGHSFRLLDSLDDGWKPFWLDTMPIEPQTTPRIAFVADNPGKWLIEGLAADDSPSAVSYTHLDVYKRQVHAQIDALVTNEHGRPSNKLAHFVLALAAERAVERILGFAAANLAHFRVPRRCRSSRSLPRRRNQARAPSRCLRAGRLSRGSLRPNDS